MQTVLRGITYFKPSHYDLSLNINRQERIFDGTVTIMGELLEDQLILHSKDLTIKTVVFDGKQADWRHGENDQLIITHPDMQPKKHIVTIGFEGTITEAMHGMYPCFYEHEDESREWIATQFESHHAREVFPCIDEPEAKATYNVTLTTETEVTVLGNMPIASQRIEDGRLVTTFDKTPIMSTYLLAWVVGEMHKKTAQTKNGVEVNVWASPAQRPESLDFALDHAVKTIDFFDEYFGIPYPLPKCDNIALPDFSSGAMENWGLVTYRETALLADPKTTTVASKQYIATVISHELSHQWFGNLVTMKWWNNLWLNESFATLMEYVAVDAIRPEWNAWLDFATHESILALRRDALEGVQPVQTDVNHPDEISTLFDGAIVYAKGARLMRMCQNFIGHEAFRIGLTNYFKEFAYKNTEADDLWRHLSRASGKDISSLMNTWISQSGYPVVKLSSDGLKQEQFFISSDSKSDQLWPIPLNAEVGDGLPELFDTKDLNATVSPLERLNVGDTSHFITHYPPEHLLRLLQQVENKEVDSIGRLQLLHEQTLLARAGIQSSAVLVDVLNSYQNETDEKVWSIIGLALGELKRFVENDQEAEKALRELSGQLAKNLYAKLGWHTLPDDDEATINLRGIILGMMVYSEAPEVIAKVDELFAGPLDEIDSELRGLILSSVIKRTSDRSLIKKLITTYQKTSSADLRDDICGGLTSAKDPQDIKFLLEHFTDGETIKSQDLPRWYVYLLRNRYGREATWQWLRNNWSFIEKAYSGDKSYDYFVVYTASGLSSRQQLQEYRDFFSPIRNQPALTRVIDLGEKEIEARVRLLERDTDPVCQKLISL